MSTYTEILNQAQKLLPEEQQQLIVPLSGTLFEPVKIEGTDEVIPADEIAASDAAIQAYRSGEDRGISLSELETELSMILLNLASALKLHLRGTDCRGIGSEV
ncbi:MAG: hypothetical protein WA902_20845 [Thermosynechococcaceae cyanobacterium]